MASRAARQALTDAGLCLDCREPKSGLGRRCETCRRINAECTRTRQRARRAAGLCVRCGLKVPPSRDGHAKRNCPAHDADEQKRRRIQARRRCRFCRKHWPVELATCAEPVCVKREEDAAAYRASRCHDCSGEREPDGARCTKCKLARRKQMDDAEIGAEDMLSRFVFHAPTMGRSRR